MLQVTYCCMDLCRPGQSHPLPVSSQTLKYKTVCFTSTQHKYCIHQPDFVQSPDLSVGLPFFHPIQFTQCQIQELEHISFLILSLYKCQWQLHSPSLITKTYTLIFLLQSFSTLLLIKFILST